MDVFTWPIRVYYEDTDSGGVVYHANYLAFMERARTEWLRNLGYEQDIIRDQYGVIFAVRHMNINYLKPARFNDALRVETRLLERRPASLCFDQRIVRENDELELCRAEIKVACLEAVAMRPCAIPKTMEI